MAENELGLELKGTDEDPILELSGRIFDIDVKRFQRKMEQLYENKKHKKVVLDVTHTNFMDSHGLGTIVYYHTLFQKEKRELILLNANQDENSYLNRLFSMTNLDKVLFITDSF